jgi:threonine/homoserine/homoserine lactone efflux protein
LATLLGAFLLVLPGYSTLLLIRAGERRSRQVFNAAAWGLALGLSLLYVSVYPDRHPALWGIWLYIGVAASALIVEMLILTAGRRLSQAQGGS